MNATRRVRRGLALLCVCAPAWVLAAPADEVKAMVEAGKASEAYLLAKKYPAALGDPVFDFYFGIASIDAGHVGEGVLALERYILTFPDNVSARLQLARGYFALGEDARAREEFEALQKLGPPAEVSATIDRFLDAIRLRETRYRTSAGAFVEAGIGSDSNINGGVADANLVLPVLGPIVVAPSGTKTSDTFTYVAAGGYVSHPVAPGIALFANGQIDQKANRKSADTQFDQGDLNLVGGVSVLRERNLYRLSLLQSTIAIGSSRFRSTTGLSGEWQYQLDERQSLSFGLVQARLTYPEPNSPRDADFTGLSAGYRTLFSHAWQPVLVASLNTGRQSSRTQRDDLVPDSWGARLGVNFTPAAKWGVSLGYSLQKSNYRAPDPFFEVSRRDKYDSVDAALTYLMTRNLSFRAEGTFATNRSNIELFSFPRDTVAFKLRYEFK